MRYPGGKGKCFHHIINLMPPHGTYIESHLGGGAVLRHKRPASRSIGLDRDVKLIGRWRRTYPDLAEYLACDAVDFLRTYRFVGDELIYADPPYVVSSRRRSRVYRYDYTDEDHDRLLRVLRMLPCAVILSGYPSRLYERSLPNWHVQAFRAKTHRGLAEEVVWCNFPPPRELHDTSHLGANFRERERTRRRLARIRRRLGQLSLIERSAVRRWLESEGGR